MHQVGNYCIVTGVQIRSRLVHGLNCSVLSAIDVAVTVFVVTRTEERNEINYCQNCQVFMKPPSPRSFLAPYNNSADVSVDVLLPLVTKNF